MQQLTWAFSNLASETKDPVIRSMLAGMYRGLAHRAALAQRLNPLSAAPNFEDFILTMLTDSDYGE